MLQHGQIADHVADQKIALRFRRKVAAGDELAARSRPDALKKERRILPVALRAAPVEMFAARTARVFVGEFDAARDGRGPVIEAGRSVGDEVLPPAVEDVPPGIGEGQRRVYAELLGPRLVSPDAGVA